jgi:DNA-directed RNA polymerase subunit L
MALNVKILEEKKNKIIFELDGDTHTVAAAMTKELWNDDKVKASGYTIDHPLLGHPQFVVETDGEEPRKAVSAAAKRLAKAAEKLSGIAAKELK